MSLRKQSILMPLMLVGAILGGIAGYLIPEFMLSVSVIGQLFLNLLKIITIPLIISVIIVGISSLGDTRKIGRTTVLSVLYFLGTSAVAIIVGIILVSLINPGVAATHAGIHSPDVVSYAKSFQFADIFKAFVPSNIFSSTSGGQYLGIIILSLIFGTVLGTMGRKAKVVLDFFNVITEVSLKAVQGILFIAPIGLFFLIGSSFASYPESLSGMVSNMSLLTLTLFAGLIVHGIIVLPVILRIFGRKSPHAYAGNMSSALVTALGTSSSTATMPVTYSCVVEKNNVDSRAGSLVIPLGSFVNLNGTAMFLAIVTIFACQMFGVSLSLLNILLIGLISLVLSFCSAGVPGSSIFMMAILFNVMNLPNEAYAALGLLVAVDWLFDRGRTTLNVWGNAVAAAVIGEGFDFKTVSKTKSTTAPKKYERSYDKKSGYKKDKPFKQDRPKPVRKTRESKKPIAKKKDKPDTRKPKPQATTTTRTKTKPSKEKIEIKVQKKQATPVAERKKEEFIHNTKPISALKPPPIPPTPKRTTPIVDNKSEMKSKADVENKNFDLNNHLGNETIERERAKIAAQLASMKEQEKSQHTKSDDETESKADTSPQIDFYSEDKPTDKKESFFEDNHILEKVKNINIPDPIERNEIEKEDDTEFDTDLKDKPFPVPKLEPKPESNAVETLKIESDSEDKSKDEIVKAVHIEKDSDDSAGKPGTTDKQPSESENKPAESEKKSEDISEDNPAESSKPEPEDKAEAEEKPEPQFGRSKTRKGIAKKTDSEGEEKSNEPPVPTSSSVSVVENEKEISFGRTKTKRTRR